MTKTDSAIAAIIAGRAFGDWALLSADRPHRPAPGALCRQLSARDIPFLPTRGCYGGVGEYSALAFTSADKARGVARYFKQDTLLVPSGLVRCHDGALLRQWGGTIVFDPDNWNWTELFGHRFHLPLTAPITDALHKAA